MERRLAAIVAADVSNYSLLLSRDEQTTLKTLNSLIDEILAPAIARYDGHIIRLMGDGSLIVFNSALHAVKFSVDVQRIMAQRKFSERSSGKIEFRIGANLGDIVRERNDIHGDGINVAVRLEEIAQPGGICLSDTLYRQAKNTISEELQPIGERYLKNIEEPVLVWRWHPESLRDDKEKGASSTPVKKHFGRQILDPKVTSSMVDLYMRSARLALSEAFDAMLTRPRTEAGMDLRDIHAIIQNSLNGAHNQLGPIYIESCRSAHTMPQTLGEFLTDAVSGNDIVFTVEMLQSIRNILSSSRSIARKRTALMQLCSDFLHERELPHVKAAIRFAFVEA
ncbi:MAG TPA: adenylate/guanylate cyclase domain-containing protein [Hyphomicrobiales bacterium]|nr:adenylate/guanylate cyclase domain-containing protein [Hyphomicrobiales bacterium]